MRYIEVFAGCGGLGYGLKESGWRSELAVEIEEDFSKVYKRNIDDKVITENIKNIDFRAYKGIDLFCGGPPCQGFSTAGKKDLEDPRNELYLEFLRGVKECTPKYILFENVEGFLSLYNGLAFTNFTNQLNGLSYNWSHKVINIANLGVPQKRKRTFILAWKNTIKAPEWPIESSKDDWVTFEDACGDLPSIANCKSKTPIVLEYLPPASIYQRDMRRGYTNKYISLHERVHGESLTKMISYIKEGGGIEDVPIELRPKSYFKNSYARLKSTEPAGTITRNFGCPSSARCIHPKENRGLTIREGARLQSFPDKFEFFGSNGKIQTMIGNAIAPKVGLEFGRTIKNALND
jgi:DNA (cytosine-5)-methyltransferase 1